MSAVEVVGLAASLSLLAGWRLYACVLATGIAMRLGVVDLPLHLAALDVFANPWVMGAAGCGCIAELLADKVAWLDSIWDAVNSIARPVGGALLALAVVDPSDTTWQVVILLLGAALRFSVTARKPGPAPSSMPAPNRSAISC